MSATNDFSTLAMFDTQPFSEGMKFQVASLAMSIVATFTFFIVDFHLPETNDIATQTVPWVGVGAVCLAWSAPLSAVAGRAYFPSSWNFFQPFEGSQIFQLHQALGWALYGLCLLAISFTVVDLNGGRHPKGETTLIGVIGLVSQLLLSHSFNFFSPSIVKAQRKYKTGEVAKAEAFIKRTSLLKDPRSWIAVVLTIISTVALICVDEQHSTVFAILLGRLAIAGHFCAAFVSHVLLGVGKIPNYRLFMPFSGGFAFLLLQSFAWLFFGILVNISLLLPAVLRYGITSTGKKLAALGVATQGLLLISLLYFHQTSHGSATLQASGATSCTGRLLLSSKGSSSWTVSVCLLPWSGLLLMAVLMLGEEVSDAYLGGKNTLSALAIAVMLSTAPLAHWSGTHMYRNYHIWQPFEGGAKYSYAQGLGWTAWSISLSMWMVYNLNVSELFTFSDALTGLVPVCFLSSALLIGSVLYFEDDEVEEEGEEEGEEGEEGEEEEEEGTVLNMPTLNLNASGGTSGSTEHTKRRTSARIRAASRRHRLPKGKPEKKSKHNKRAKRTNTKKIKKRTKLGNTRTRTRTPTNRTQRSPPKKLDDTNQIFWHGYRWSNEDYLTFMIACANQILCIATDMARQDVKRIMSPLIFFWGSYFGVLVVPGLVMMAGMKRWNNFRVFQPFRGGTTFVAWQAFGWTLYSAGFLLHSVLLVIPEDLLSGDRISEWPLMFTIAGIPSFVSHCTLIFSVTKFVPGKTNNDPTLNVRMSPPCSPIHSTPRRRKKKKRNNSSPKNISNRSSRSTMKTTEIEEEENAGREKASTISQTVSIAVALASLVLPIVVDVVIHQNTSSGSIDSDFPHSTDESGPMYALFVCSCISAFFGAFFTHVVCGFLLHSKTYTFFQPFHGGVPFVMLQAIGWLLVGCGGLGALMIIEIGGPTKTPFFGITTVLGIVLFIGQITLLSSLRWYYDDTEKDDNDDYSESDESDESNESDGNGIRRDDDVFDTFQDAYPPRLTRAEEKQNRAVVRSAIASVTLCVGGLFLFTFADYAMLQYGPSFPAGPLIVCGIIAVCGSVPVSWLLSGPSSHNHQFTLIGTFGWALWSFTFMLGAWTLLNMATTTSHNPLHNATMIDATAKAVRSAAATGATGAPGATTSSIDVRATRPSRLASIVGIAAQGLLAYGVLKPPPPTRKSSQTTQPQSYGKQWFSYFVSWTVTCIRTTIRWVGPTTSVLLCTVFILRQQLMSAHAWLVGTFGWNIVAMLVVLSSLIIFPVVTSLTVRIWMKQTVIQVWCTHLAQPTGFVVTFVGYWCILPILRVWLDWPAWFYHYWWFHHGVGHVSQDGLPVGQNTNIVRNKRYGTHDLELLNIYEPISYTGIENRGPLMFIHGGGWVAVNREVMGQSITPFVRAGFTVYSIDYPLAPESKYPGPLVSVLRACTWVKWHSECNHITLVGDSAGGNLATMAAAMMSNDHLLLDLEKRAIVLEYPMYETLPMTQWNLPTVQQVVSMYGVVDRTAWQEPCSVENESVVMWFMWEGTAKVLSFCFDCYSPNALTAQQQQMYHTLYPNEKDRPIDIDRYLTLGDYCDNRVIDRYPPTLFICGVGDPLVLANRKVRDLLQNSNHVQCSFVDLLEFPGPHAFHGIPPQWTLDGWRSNSYPTTREMLMFLTNGDIQLPNSTMFQPPDWSLPLVLLAHVVMVVGLIVQFVNVFLE